MQRFKKILVGVDLGWAHRAVAEELSDPNREAVRQAIWLAKINGASIHFLFCLDLSAKAQQLIRNSGGHEQSLIEEAEGRLAELVTEAQADGVEASCSVVIGKSWLKMIHEVMRNEFDLVVVGTRHEHSLGDFLLGSTAIKLVRKCPCPVWITKPLTKESLNSIVVAHDLRPVGEHALELGCAMAELQDAELHVVHATDFTECVGIYSVAFPLDEVKADYCKNARKAIEIQIEKLELDQPFTVDMQSNSPESAIIDCAKKNNADLIVIGTVGRAGIAGLITGNTAERLMPRIPCSLLAVKPENFKSPVELTEA